MDRTDFAAPAADRSPNERTTVTVDRAEAALLRLIAEDCSPCSYRGMGIWAPLWSWVILTRLEARRLIEGSFRLGWRLTEAGWATQSEVKP